MKKRMANMRLRAMGASAALAAAILPGSAFSAQAANLIQNPGFETGDLTSWNSTGWFVTSGSVGSVNPSPPPGGGAYFASTGCFTYCDLSQTVTTTPGLLYSLSFEFNPGYGVTTGGADTLVYWDGTPVLDVGLGPLGWTTYTVNGLVGAGSDTLTFSAYQNPGFNGLDNVFVGLVGESASGPVPGAGLSGIAFLFFAGAAMRFRNLVAERH
jgi:hypothetical protein